MGVTASFELSNGAEGRVMVGVGGEDDERMCNVRGDSGTGSRCASQCDEGEMAGTDGEGEGGAEFVVEGRELARQPTPAELN